LFRLFKKKDEDSAQEILLKLDFRYTEYIRSNYRSKMFSSLSPFNDLVEWKNTALWQFNVCIYTQNIVSVQSNGLCVAKDI
jgi:hypothetical protein